MLDLTRLWCGAPTPGDGLRYDEAGAEAGGGDGPLPHPPRRPPLGPPRPAGGCSTQGGRRPRDRPRAEG